MAGTSEGGEKAAQTRKENHPAGTPGSFEEAGQKGGKSSHDNSSKDKDRR